MSLRRGIWVTFEALGTLGLSVTGARVVGGSLVRMAILAVGILNFMAGISTITLYMDMA
jgi:hypothetical protein